MDIERNGCPLGAPGKLCTSMLDWGSALGPVCLKQMWAAIHRLAAVHSLGSVLAAVHPDQRPVLVELVEQLVLLTM